MALQVIREDILKKMEDSVNGFVKQTHVKCAMVADKSGQLIMQVGFTASLDLRSLAALVSGIFVSGEELAKILGESHFVVLYHEGRNMSIFFSLIALDYIFVAIFDDRTNMGVVQLYSNEVKEALAPVLEEAEETTKGAREASNALDLASAEQLLDDDELDGFFQQGLDDDLEAALISEIQEEEEGEEEEEAEERMEEEEIAEPEEEVKAAEVTPGVPDSLQEERDEDMAALLEWANESEDVERIEEPERVSEEEAAVVDNLDDLFQFGSEEDEVTGDELSKLFDDITMEEEPAEEGEDDVKSLRDGLDDLFDL